MTRHATVATLARTQACNESLVADECGAHRHGRVARIVHRLRTVARRRRCTTVVVVAAAATAMMLLHLVRFATRLQ